jgi:hypothetical protein
VERSRSSISTPGEAGGGGSTLLPRDNSRYLLALRSRVGVDAFTPGDTWAVLDDSFLLCLTFCWCTAHICCVVSPCSTRMHAWMQRSTCGQRKACQLSVAGAAGAAVAAWGRRWSRRGALAHVLVGRAADVPEAAQSSMTPGRLSMSWALATGEATTGCTCVFVRVMHWVGRSNHAGHGRPRPATAAAVSFHPSCSAVRRTCTFWRSVST